MRSIGFLAHDQLPGSKAKTFVEKDDADLLVQEMFAERLSAKLIRAFPPNSPFRMLHSRSGAGTGVSKISFTSGEVSNARYQAPSDPAWQELHGMASRSLRTRSYMTFKAWKQQFAGRRSQEDLQRATA
jgi:hypothetical protein